MNSSEYPDLTPIEAPLFYMAKKAGLNIILKPIVTYLDDMGRQSITPDFVCYGASEQVKVAVECDGKTHEKPERKAKDRARDTTLRSLGYVVLRFSTNEIWGDGANKCIEKIQAAIAQKEEECRQQAKDIRRNILATQDKLKPSLEEIEDERVLNEVDFQFSPESLLLNSVQSGAKVGELYPEEDCRGQSRKFELLGEISLPFQITGTDVRIRDKTQFVYAGNYPLIIKSTDSMGRSVERTFLVEIAA